MLQRPAPRVHRATNELAQVGAKVAALSVDDEARTVATIAKHGLSFPVGHGADAAAISPATGAFVNPDPVFLQSTGFVLDPTGTVLVSVYSSSAIGRLVPEDVIGMIGYVRSQPTTRFDVRATPAAFGIGTSRDSCGLFAA